MNNLAVFISAQNFHENLNPKQSLLSTSDRSFGLTMGGVLVILGLFLFRKFLLFFALCAWALSLILLIVALKYPTKLNHVHVKWMKLGEKLRLFFTPMILTIFFFVFLTPLALILKCFKKDLLRIKKTNIESYWLQAEEASSFKNQF